MQYSSSKGSQAGMGIWVEVGVIDCVAGERGVGGGEGVLVSAFEFVSGGIVRSGSISGTLEQPVATINRDNKRYRLMRHYVSSMSIAVLAIALG